VGVVQVAGIAAATATTVGIKRSRSSSEVWQKKVFFVSRNKLFRDFDEVNKYKYLF
jgi:hypothetical protein